MCPAGDDGLLRLRMQRNRRSDLVAMQGSRVVRVYLRVVVVTVDAVTAVGDGNSRRPVCGRGVLVVVVILQVVLLLPDVVPAEEIAARRDVIALAVLLAGRELGVDDDAGGEVLGLLVARRQSRSRDRVHQKRTHDH